MIVRVLNKSHFDTVLPRMRIDDSNVEKHLDKAFISILNSEFSDFYFSEDHYNVLRLKFDDETIEGNELRRKKGLRESQLFTRKQGEQIVEFLEKNRNVDTLYVHCLAGVSRSGAVGTFANDIYGNKAFYEFCNSNPIIKPNYFILALLRRVYNGIEGDE
jgi:predicted protein tyrosine phosphatase